MKTRFIPTTPSQPRKRKARPLPKLETIGDVRALAARKGLWKLPGHLKARARCLVWKYRDELPQKYRHRNQSDAYLHEYHEMSGLLEQLTDYE